MAHSSLSHKLTFSQEQMQAFVEFKEAGSEFFYRHCNSIAQHERWGNACISTVFILVAACQPSVEYNFGLTEEHANSLREMLKLVDEVQKYYPKCTQNFDEAAAETLLKKMLSTSIIFSNAVENMIEKK